MYGGAPPFYRGDFQAGHKAFHNGKAHTAAFRASGGEAGPPGLLYVRNTHALIFDDNIQNIVFEDPAAKGDDANSLG